MLKRPYDEKQRQWFQREVKVKGQKLGILKSFEYLETVVLDDGLLPEAVSQTAHAT